MNYQTEELSPYQANYIPSTGYDLGSYPTHQYGGEMESVSRSSSSSSADEELDEFLLQAYQPLVESGKFLLPMHLTLTRNWNERFQELYSVLSTTTDLATHIDAFANIQVTFSFLPCSLFFFFICFS